VGVEDRQFMGLAIDEVNQPELTTKRVESWVKQLIREFELAPTQQV
jgi:flavodoxin